MRATASMFAVMPIAPHCRPQAFTSTRIPSAVDASIEKFAPPDIPMVGTTNTIEPRVLESGSTTRRAIHHATSMLRSHPSIHAVSSRSVKLCGVTSDGASQVCTT